MSFCKIQVSGLLSPKTPVQWDGWESQVSRLKIVPRNSTGGSDGQPGMGSLTLAWVHVLSRLNPETDYAHIEVLGWPKSLFNLFHMRVQKNPAGFLANPAEDIGCFRTIWFSKCVVPDQQHQECDRNADSWAPSPPTESETLRVEPLCLNKLPRWFWYPVHFETMLLKEDLA